MRMVGMDLEWLDFIARSSVETLGGAEQEFDANGVERKHDATTFDAIARATSLSLRTVATTISLLELEGLLSVDITGTVRSSIGRQAQ